jgi:glycosyltransferase involved in cell wall biosynthesis
VFFQEQALLAMQDFDVRVLVLSSVGIGRRGVARWVCAKVMGPSLVAAPVSNEQPPALRWTLNYAAPCEQPLLLESAIAQLAQQLSAQSWKADLIHAQCAINGGQIASALSAKLGVPYVITEHQHLIFDYFTRASWESALSVYQGAAHVAVVSEFQRRMMLMNGAKSEMRVLGNFVDEERFTLAKPRMPTDAHEVLFIGTTSRLKDHATFFKAMTILRETCGHPFSVKVVSPDFQRGEGKQLELAANEHGLSDIIEILPSAGREQIVGMIHRCSVFVSTSIAETFGVAICEALMCGRPVVVTESGGVADFVRHGVNGYVVPIGDADAVATHVQKVFAGGLSAPATTIRASVEARYGRAAFRASLRALYA